MGEVKEGTPPCFLVCVHTNKKESNLRRILDRRLSVQIELRRTLVPSSPDWDILVVGTHGGDGKMPAIQGPL